LRPWWNPISSWRAYWPYWYPEILKFEGLAYNPMPPRISVIIPTFNRAAWVREAVDSVLAQTFQDFELLVVDDGSTDETGAGLAPYGDRLRYLYQVRQGVSAARNRGLELAAGEWITFLDSDDLWLPRKLETQVDFFYMDYIPDWERVHINVHYIVVVGKNDSCYRVSDSYFPKVVDLRAESLRKARFAGGSMSPKGFLFYPEFIPSEINYPEAIKKGIEKTCFDMLKIPMPFLGVKGIRKFAGKITEWPGFARDIEHLSHEIMKINILLEDQGTGGAGFRFIYATFLQQASEILHKPELLDLSRQMMEIGDGWREISLFAARIGKNRDLGKERLQELGRMLSGRADLEEDFFRRLRKTIKE